MSTKRAPIVLFINYWNDKNPIRLAELKSAILDNCSNPYISKIYLVYDKNTHVDISHPKITPVYLEWRPTYHDFFHIINYFTDTPDQINMLSNTDIVFDTTIKRIFELDMNNTCAELSRYEPNGKIENWGEDVWIFKGKINFQVWANFTLGLLACDYRITYELGKVGYKVINPSLSIITRHRHQSGVRNYPGVNNLWKGENHTIPQTIEQILGITEPVS